MSLILLLVGLGGWISLMAAQGYQYIPGGPEKGTGFYRSSDIKVAGRHNCYGSGRQDKDI